jgi:hypothetical protein
MLNENFIRIRSHCNNTHRCRRLLNTRLTDLERQFIERRLSEEQAGLNALASETFLLAFTAQKISAGQARMEVAP